MADIEPRPDWPPFSGKTDTQMLAEAVRLLAELYIDLANDVGASLWHAPDRNKKIAAVRRMMEGI